MRNIVWLRRELRINDNPALYAATLGDSEVLPVFIWPGGSAMPGAASRWWLHGSLLALSDSLESLGAPLVIRVGEADRVLSELARQYNADSVFWSRAYDPDGRRQDDSVEKVLRRQGTKCRIFAGVNLLLNPVDIKNKSGAPYKIFTPFYKRAVALTVDKPVPAPGKLMAPGERAKGVVLSSLGLEPKIDWAAGLRETWKPGEVSAAARLDGFMGDGLKHYGTERDIPSHEGTSRLSPHLHFGEISPRSVYHTILEQEAFAKDKISLHESEAYLRQLYWREFAHYLLYHFPHMYEKPMYPEYDHFPWRSDRTQLRAWQRGRTGYPIVDAGMRELWTTGWMHNRVRMIVGSFLVKDLLLSWQAGAEWFRETLVDADPANNTLGWQWVGGCGPDAAPYFRIFNPVLQSKRYDSAGLYIKRWIPELGGLRGNALHAPWTASSGELQEAGIIPGKTYPFPMVDHAGARERALMAYNAMKSSK